VSPGAETHKKSVTLVLGGAQSGKSHYAQQLASHYERVTFIATGRGTDAEMRRKIARHRRERPKGWRTIEAPLSLEKAIHVASQHSDVVLIDCLTLYVANIMSAAKKSKTNSKGRIEAVCEAVRAANSYIVMVSNEVGSGVVPPYRSGRIYRDFLGQMNRTIAQIADRVVLMIAGVPMTIKEPAADQQTRGAGSMEPASNQLSAVASGFRKKDSGSQERFR
jgi:adenosylcobinamide kinase / adenosylcobinamide-phosphate guanylyltransferase